MINKPLHPQIIRMQKIAEENGGKLLDMEWKTTKHKYKFLYNKNDEDSHFMRKAESLFREERGWPDYKNNPHLLLKAQTTNKAPEEKLKEMSDIAQANGAKLTSTKWSGTKNYYDFEFNGKTYEITYNHIINYKWPANLERYSNVSKDKQNFLSNESKVEEIKALAKKYNFELLGDYINKKTPLKFLDKSNDEIFYISHKAILEGKFENQYYGKKGLIAEPVCQQALEHLLGFKFEKRQDILNKKITGRNTYLELDGYCEELKIAFEYQGHPSHWDTNHYRYEETIKKDQEKKYWCKQLNILLLQIPNLKRSRDLNGEVVIKTIITVLKQTCNEHNIALPVLNAEKFMINYEKINHSKTMLKKLDALANENNAKLLSKKWNGIDSYYKFEQNGKEFSINYRKLQEIGWPSDLEKFLALSDGHKKTDSQLLEELQKFAKSKNAKLKETEWKGVEYKYTFESLEDESITFTYSKKNINGVNRNKKLKNDKPSKQDIAFEKLKQLTIENDFELKTKEWRGGCGNYEFEKNGYTLTINYEYLRKKGFPQDIEKFLKHSQASKVGHKNRD